MWDRYLLCVFLHLLLPNTDGLSNDNIHITGPELFITDGSRNLTLTCLATDANPGTVYSWDVTCVNYTQHSGNCTATPRLDQDNTTIFCTAIHKEQTSQARYTLNLTYPPQAAPAITSSRPGEILQDGDTVTCTVTGGKPLVSAVTLSCTNKEDDTVTTDESVSSSVNVSITGATESCRCNATWEPDPGLYTNETTFLPPFSAKAKNFTVNGSTDGLIVNENDTNVIFYCRGTGRPAPNVSISSSSGSENIAQKRSRPDDTTTVTTYLIPLVSCSNMGSYTCLAENGISEEKSASLQLDVLCSPRLEDAKEPNSKDNPATLYLESHGITLNITACPVPNMFQYTFLSEDGDKQEDVPKGRFDMRAEQVKNSSVVTCTITPINVPEKYLGTYSVNVSNGLGGVLFYFRVMEEYHFVIVYGTAVVPGLAPVGFFIAVAERRRQAIAVPLWIPVALITVAAFSVLASVIVAAVSKALILIEAFSLLLATAVVKLIVAILVLVGVKKGKQAGAVPWWIYLLGAITPVAAVVALVLVAVYADTLQLYQRSFGIIISCIVLDAVVAAIVVITVFMWHIKETPKSVQPNDNMDCAPHAGGRSNPAYQRNDHQLNLYDSGSDPGYASTEEMTTNPLKGQGSATAPTSDRDQFGYSCPRDQIAAGDSQSRKASGAPFYAEAGVGNATVEMRDGENRQPGPHMSTISIAPNGDVYNVVSKRAMGDNTAGGKKIDDG